MRFASIIKHTTRICYLIICIVLCVFMIYLIINQFSGNKDSSEVSYRKFKEEQGKNIGYPVFSICTPGVNGAIFYPLVHTELYPKLYNHSECTKPGITHHWCEISLYQNMLLGSVEPLLEASTQDVVAITKSILDSTERFLFLDDYGGWVRYNKKSMYLSYQDSLRICFTKISERGMGRNHTYDLYGINAETLNLPLEVYIHQVGGLIEQLGKKYVLLITNTEIKELYANWKATKSTSSSGRQGITVFHDFHVRKIEVLKKRPNAVIPCNETINDNDKVYKEALIKEVGCVPSYWKSFFDNGKDEYLPDCNTRAQFERMSNMLPMMFENTNLLNGSRLYTPPCKEMKISTTINKRNERTVDHRLWLGFYYDADEFLEIVNNEAYSSYDLWSQIGGIIGIFLGYSILQVIYNINNYMTNDPNPLIDSFYYLIDTRDDIVLFDVYQGINRKNGYLKTPAFRFS